MTNELPTTKDLRASWQADGTPEGITRVYHDLVFDYRKAEERLQDKAQRFAADAADTAKRIAAGERLESLGFAYAARDAAELEALRTEACVLREKALNVRSIIEDQA